MWSQEAFASVDGPMVVRALWGVSSSPPMPKYPEYVAAVEELKGRANAYNPAGPEIGEGLTALAERRGAGVGAELPWARGEVTWARLIAGITSFTDDYEGPFPAELFPEAQVAEVMVHLSRRASARGRPLTVIEQLDVGLSVCEGSVFGAAAALHAASRVVARGRDTRALPGLSLSLAGRLERSTVFAAFQDADSRGGDPLGDTYHYWAMVLGGLWCGDARRSRSARARATTVFLRHGADLMWLVRDRLFGSTLFFGRHKEIDRLGLAHGLLLAGHSAMQIGRDRDAPRCQPMKWK